MDTGLGSKAYSIIEQGKIGLILSSKPADRRALIEEAAGITKYKARRRQTQLKLEAAQQNLLRVNDIVHEVEKQLELAQAPGQQGAALPRRARGDAGGRARPLRPALPGPARGVGRASPSALAVEGQREQAAAIALQSEEAQMEVRRTALYEDEARLEEVRARLSELTLAVDRHQGRSGYCKEQIAETDARAAQARAEAEELRARVGPLADRVDERRSDEARLRVERAAAEDEARTAESAQAEAAARQSSSEAELDAARDAQVDLMGRIAASQNARESVGGTAARASADLLKLAAETAELERSASGSKACAPPPARARPGGGEPARGAGAVAGGRGGAREPPRARRRRRATREAEAHQSERDSLAGRLASLEEMVATHSAFDEGVRALLAGPEGIDNAPLSYNDQVRDNFVNAGCMGNVPGNGGTTTSLASSPVCLCSYAVFVANVPYNEDDRNRDPYKGYAGKNFEELNNELIRDASKYNDNTVLTQAVRDKINQCVQTNGASTPGTGPAGQRHGRLDAGVHAGTDPSGTVPR